MIQICNKKIAPLQPDDWLTDRNPLGAIQTFDLFLSADGMPYVLILFEVNEAVDFVSLREPFELATLVLEDAFGDVVGHPCVNASRLAGHDVDPKSELTHSVDVNECW